MIGNVSFTGKVSVYGAQEDVDKLCEKLSAAAKKAGIPFAKTEAIDDVHGVRLLIANGKEAKLVDRFNRQKPDLKKVTGLTDAIDKLKKNKLYQIQLRAIGDYVEKTALSAKAILILMGCGDFHPVKLVLKKF